MQELYVLLKAKDTKAKDTLDAAVAAAARKKGISFIEFAELYLKQIKEKAKPKTKSQNKLPAKPKEALPPPEILPWKGSATSLTKTNSALFPTEFVTPKVLYTPRVKAGIDFIVANNTLEVGWLGTVKRIPQGYLIDQIYLPEQVVSATETLISPDAMATLWEEIFAVGGDPSELYYWGHSHVNMQVSPSGQDESQVMKFLRGCPTFIRGIYNKRGDSKVDVYDTANRTIFQCVDDLVEYSMEKDDMKKLHDLIAANVKTPPRIETKRGNKDWSNPYKHGPMSGFELSGLTDEEYACLASDPFYVGK
jgi:hypothetical protein